MTGAGVDWSPAPQLLLLAGLLAALLLAWVDWRGRKGAQTHGSAWLAALTALTLFLTFDLIVVGAFTRLSDSGLGCPDWPGCYGEASPLAAHEDIRAAEAAQPTGPVTWGKAWIEMLHRYLAMVLGALALVLSVGSAWHRRHLPHSLGWPLGTLAWVIVQGLFGKYTVTLKLYPAIVTLHLLGGLALLALLVVQHARWQGRALALTTVSRRWLGAALAALIVQVSLGGWVSTNYAVLACQGFPSCNGQWWPAMEVSQGFTLLRELGRAGHGGFLPVEALVAIHMAHRAFAVVLLVAMAGLLRQLWRQPHARPLARGLLALLLLQITTGLANVILQWPLVAALAHTAGAAALVGLLVWLLACSATVPSASPHWLGATRAA
jgi:heme a synthase